MGEENAAELVHLNSRLSGAAHHSGARIDQIDLGAGEDGDRGTAAVGFRIRRASAEQDHTGVLRGAGCGEESERGGETHATRVTFGANAIRSGTATGEAGGSIYAAAAVEPLALYPIDIGAGITKCE
jgi:hypothetical protein